MNNFGVDDSQAIGTRFSELEIPELWKSVFRIFGVDSPLELMAMMVAFIKPIESLQLPAKVYNRLRQYGVLTVYDLMSLTNGEEDLLLIPNFGSTTVQLIKSSLGSLGLRLRMGNRFTEELRLSLITQVEGGEEMPKYFVVKRGDHELLVLASGQTLESVTETLEKALRFGEEPLLLEVKDFEVKSEILLKEEV